MARGEIDATVRIEGLGAFRRDIKRLNPVAERELRDDLAAVAGRVAAAADSRVNHRGAQPSWSYRGTATGLRASVRSTGRKGFVARFYEFGFHPGGSGTFVAGRHPVGSVLEQREEQIVEQLGDAIERAALKTGWH